MTADAATPRLPEIENKYLSTVELAQRWGVSTQHVRNLIGSKRLVAMRMGKRQWRVSLQAILIFEEARSNRQAIETAEQFEREEAERSKAKRKLDMQFRMLRWSVKRK